MAKILIVEDDAFFSDMVRNFLIENNHSVKIAHNGLLGYEIYKDFKPDIVITDLIMPEEDGLGLLNRIKHNKECKIIAISGGGEFLGAEFLNVAKILGAYKTFHKPFELKNLNETINGILNA